MIESQILGRMRIQVLWKSRRPGEHVALDGRVFAARNEGNLPGPLRHINWLGLFQIFMILNASLAGVEILPPRLARTLLVLSIICLSWRDGSFGKCKSMRLLSIKPMD
jgi:hypothetical protein